MEWLRPTIVTKVRSFLSMVGVLPIVSVKFFKNGHSINKFVKESNQIWLVRQMWVGISGFKEASVYGTGDNLTRRRKRVYYLYWRIKV